MIQPILPVFHKRDHSKFKTTLPVEIWMMIIHHVLDFAGNPDTYCQRTRACAHAGRIKIKNNNWSSLRLVCHAWAQLVGPCNQSSLLQDTLQLTQTINMPEVGRLVSLTLKDGYSGSMMDLFLDNSSKLQAIRSLTLLFPEWATVPNYWLLLSVKYPLLVYLSVSSGCRLTRVITFKHLQSLVIIGPFHSPSHYTKSILPSLRNLALGYRHSELWDFLIDYGNQLHALTLTSLPDHAQRPTRDFWASVPNLLVLDTSHECLTLIGPPPAGHPLQRLCVHAFPYGWKQLDRLHRMLSNFPTVTQFLLAETKASNSVQRSLRRHAGRRGADFSMPPFNGSYSNAPWYEYVFLRCHRMHRKRDIFFLPFVVMILFVPWTVFALGLLVLFCILFLIDLVF